PGIVPKFGKTPGSIRSIAPDLGENNEEILKGLGYSQEEIETLKQNEVI
ncbi:CoA transferase, partial [Terribacillus saccharophilus]|nr:CoA transferase [Terribacillus saccharophilus]